MTFGDALTLVGLATAILFYALERAWARRRDLWAARALLRAVRDGMGPTSDEEKGWASVFFDNVWADEKLEGRAQADYDAVMEGGYNQVFEVEVPTAPLESLIVAPGAGDLIDRRTIEAANHALFQIGIFNQLVRQQTDFWTNHLAEIADEDLPTARRTAIARAARAQSRMLHQHGVGEAGGADGWFTALLRALDSNVDALTRQTEPRWWRRMYVHLALALVTGTLALAVWQGIESDPSRELPSPTTPTTTPSLEPAE